MKSRLYQGTVSHLRHAPGHSFSYPVWYVWLNLDEIPEFCNLSSWLSFERFNLLGFYRQDYLPGDIDLKLSVTNLIQERTGRNFSGSVYLLTTLRQLGYTMNPISLFYCYESEQSKPSCVVAEVHNTPWGERHAYVLDVQASSQPEQHKEFHVSPFMPMDLVYEFRLPAPGEKLQVGIRLLEDKLPVFNASLDLQAIPANADSFKRLFVSHGWQSTRTIFRIYLQALKLWWKKATFFPHPGRKRNENEAIKDTTR